MLNTLRFCVCSVTRSSCANYSIKREARILQKLIDRGLKKKNNVGQSTGKLSEEFNPVKGGGIPSKREAMLNKVYVKNLMDIMSMGKNSHNLHQLGIHITKVKLSDHLKLLNIYWVSSNLSNFTEEELKKILNQTASELEYQITAFRVTGRTPKVRFVRDLARQSYLQIENLLLNLKDEEEETTESSTDPPSNMEDEIVESLGEYTQDVLGLDHSKIMGRILAAKAKAKTFDSSPDHTDRGRVEKLITFDRKTFEKFYLRKHILARKMKKMESRSNFGNTFSDYYEVEEDLGEPEVEPEGYHSDDEMYEKFKDLLNGHEDDKKS